MTNHVKSVTAAPLLLCILPTSSRYAHEDAPHNRVALAIILCPESQLIFSQFPDWSTALSLDIKRSKILFINECKMNTLFLGVDEEMGAGTFVPFFLPPPRQSLSLSLSLRVMKSKLFRGLGGKLGGRTTNNEIGRKEGSGMRQNTPGYRSI